jgi:uncharacterized protein with HEPN domain
MQQGDPYLLMDMLMAARQACFYLENVSVQKFYADDILQDAVFRQVQIIGEAAGRVTKEFQQAHPEVPWEDIVGMRNRLVHNYRRIDRDIVWLTVRDDLPSLIALLEPLVPPDEPA